MIGLEWPGMDGFNFYLIFVVDGCVWLCLVVFVCVWLCLVVFGC